MTAPETLLPGYPSFVKELVGTLAVHSQYVLHGNVRDQFLVEPPGQLPKPTTLTRLLWEALESSDYQALLCYDPVDGISVYPPQAVAAGQQLLGSRAIGRRPSLDQLRGHLGRVAGMAEMPPPESGGTDPGPPQGQQQPPQQQQQPAALAKRRHERPTVRAAFVLDYAARIIRTPGQLELNERDFFLYCQKLALTADPIEVGGRRGALFNPIIWIVEGERDLPAWLTTGVEPIRTIALGMPTLDDREKMARALIPSLPGFAEAAGEMAGDAVAEFAKRTDGMTLRSMQEVTKLARDRGLGIDRVADAVRMYKLGVEDNKWKHDSVRHQINRGQELIRERIIGQDRAIDKTLDILKRAALGLSGAQATSTVSRPRGVLFFAGPTGVGKTELAKQVAELLFGDANAYLRFDMSEFAADHAADRLIGAPPGYVGFEAGGELTGAVRRNPFQVVLFDEIEKAHKSVLDKFLQILEDGRLTDGQGITTYFSECVLIFTSNLGVSETDPQTGDRRQLVKPGMPYPELEQTVKTAVRDHFTDKLGRPELLNRLGDNIVVFNFITAEVARRVFDLQVRNIVAKVARELRISLEITDTARHQLAAACTVDLPNGGRGIGNLLESNLINPLARLLFDRDCQPGARVVVTDARAGSVTAGPQLEAYITEGVPVPADRR
ncbi:AAA family ATPase [Allorhizocola rhizosphaerae]|uniref:AAA family ATPase n=1 Tax=Allorhizocola rhizosphaerae TaxID=1872709 RepID=UPI000E3D7541|nr:AAA family ATPase [Allorhizocola rhizosphaerae]